MNNREVLVSNDTKYSSYFKVFTISIALDLIFLLIFPLTIMLLGYEEFSNYDWISLWLIILIIDIIGFILSMCIVFLSKNTVILKEEDKILFLKIPKSINISSSNQVMIGNVVYQNSDNLFSSIIGATMVFSGLKNGYQDSTQNVNTKQFQEFNIEDILSNPFIDYKYYENCKLIEQNKSYSLYSAKLRKKDGTLMDTKFKIENYYKKVY